MPSGKLQLSFLADLAQIEIVSIISAQAGPAALLTFDMSSVSLPLSLHIFGNVKTGGRLGDSFL
jgi:hypothetical protein